MNVIQLSLTVVGLLSFAALLYMAFAGPSAAKESARRLETVRFRHSENASDRVEAQLKKAVAARKRGRPVGSTKADAKVAVNLRLDSDLLAVLRATGDGWQTRVNKILRERFEL